MTSTTVSHNTFSLSIKQHMSINPDSFTLEQKLYIAESLLEMWAEYGEDDPIGGADFIDSVSTLLNTTASKEGLTSPDRTVHSAVLTSEYGPDLYIARTKDELLQKVANDLLAQKKPLLALEASENGAEIKAHMEENPSYGLDRYFSEAAPIDHGIKIRVHRI
jgi:hypothetical protein